MGIPIRPVTAEELEALVNLHRHGRLVCSCGAVIAQCRCIDGHKNQTVVQNGCKACAEKQ